MQKALYDRYCGRFYMLCRRYSYNDSSAQEVLSDGFLTVFEQMGNFSGKGSFEGWMRTIFVRCAIKRFKQDRNRVETRVDDEIKTLSGEVDPSSRLDLRQALMESMRLLPDIERQSFNLVAVEGYKLEEASDLLGENLSTIKSRYYKALQKMRVMLASFLGDDYLRDWIAEN